MLLAQVVSRARSRISTSRLRIARSNARSSAGSAGQRGTDPAPHLSVKTVSTHKTHIQDKLQWLNMAALIRHGLEHGSQADDGRGDPVSSPGKAAN